ncbi:efflux transporter periplasmic adaptor subunit [Rhodoferax lacus]|uniref:Efflux transporter periplasmic adaptor subunit n=1 Tax=Rhodoferax lacus TaxID=2184758 RepID=A0A3E1R9K3_9BURK|nr:efflux transporter periplasmic adaptor subunit [Rhodoferax lacus]RFO96044.1 efflux transporter periplasmic adaptor subunit [Rhodoferax lacus]
MAPHRHWLWGGVAVLAALAALAWAFWPRPVEVEVAPITRGVFESTVEEDCKTHLSERYTLSTPVTAALERTSLREGDTVRRGDVVARLQAVDAALLDPRSHAEALARQRSASVGVNRAQTQLNQATLALADAWRELQRTHHLAEQGFVADARLDSARLAVSAARNALDVAGADKDMAIQEQALASAALQSPRPANAKQWVLMRAPVDGVVLRLAQTDAVTVTAGTALLELGDLAHMEVLCELLTSDAARTPPGSVAHIDYGSPQRVQGLRAAVRLVEPAGFTKVSALGVEEQRVRVHLDVVAVDASADRAESPDAWRRLGEGFRVGVRISLHRVEHAVLVPVGALVPQGDAMAVYVLDGRRVRLQPIAVGERNANVAWVQDGLQPGQSVVLYPPTQLVSGQKVQVRAP